MISLEIKEQLYRHCHAYVERHIETNQKAIAQAQEAARSETKTVASEEPETGKERMQREIESYGRRLEESLAEKSVLDNLDFKKKHSKITAGALVETSLGCFYISLSADEIEIGGEEYCPISLASPIGQALKDKKIGETASFRGRDLAILDIC